MKNLILFLAIFALIGGGMTSFASNLTVGEQVTIVLDDNCDKCGNDPCSCEKKECAKKKESCAKKEAASSSCCKKKSATSSSCAKKGAATQSSCCSKKKGASKEKVEEKK